MKVEVLQIEEVYCLRNEALVSMLVESKVRIEKGIHNLHLEMLFVELVPRTGYLVKSSAIQRSSSLTI